MMASQPVTVPFDLGKAARSYLLSVYEELMDEVAGIEEMTRRPFDYTDEAWDEACERLAGLQRQTRALMQELARFLPEAAIYSRGQACQ